MPITKGVITVDIPDRVNSPALEESLKQSIGDGIGWALEYDDEKNIIGIRYEYEASLGHDPAAVEAFFKDYELPAHEDDDFQESEKKQAAERGMIERLADLEARVSALEGKK